MSLTWMREVQIPESKEMMFETVCSIIDTAQIFHSQSESSHPHPEPNVDAFT